VPVVLSANTGHLDLIDRACPIAPQVLLNVI
jgi:phosphopantetheine adenylyltransferase